MFYLQVLELLQEAGDEGFDTMCLLQTLGQVKTDVLDSKNTCSRKDNKDTNIAEEWILSGEGAHYIYLVVLLMFLLSEFAAQCMPASVI